MAHELSPAVERARDAARRWADRRGDQLVRLGDWMLGLIEEDEGKPAMLLARLGVEPGVVRDALIDRAGAEYPAAEPDSILFVRARDRAIELRGDPALTTEFVLLAVLDADPAFSALLAELGVRAAELEALVRAPTTGTALPDEPGPAFEIGELTELADAGRVVDASLNRAREALRVLDDYCRFVLNDGILTESLKRLRHDLAAAESLLPTRLLLAARDTPGDVGTHLTAGREYERQSPAAVAAINFKRLQEALRSLEEFGKVLDPEFARRVERLRYETYTVEQAIVSGTAARSRLANVRLYLLLGASQCEAALDWTIAEAAAGGVGAIQLREKGLTDRDLLDRARQVRRWTRSAGVLFIVNDRPDIARLAGADGVHLGQDDLPVTAARQILGPDALIGVSTHSPDQVRQAVHDGADYLGVGPTFPSKTKEFAEFPGLDFVGWATAATSLPVFALGGIDAGNVAQVVEAGASRVAVSAAIARVADPQAAASRIRQSLPG
jgi:thiamine-phosphate pyrophosphorylase